MKTVITIIFITILNLNSFSQIIDDLNGEKFNCDSAYTTLELGLCSRFLLEQSIAKYDSLLIRINACLDTLIVDDKQFREGMLKEDPKLTFDYWTDFVKLKDMFNQSDKVFRNFATIEKNITGEFYGLGRERTIGENLRMKSMYDSRIEELLEVIERHCG